MSVAIAILVVTPLALVSGILLAMCTSPKAQRSSFGKMKNRWDFLHSIGPRNGRRTALDLPKVELIGRLGFATTTWSVGRDVIDTNKERWKELCEQAANEQDPANLAELVKEINDLLDARRLRLIQPSDTPEDRNGAST
jgi:hypothetical protein